MCSSQSKRSSAAEAKMGNKNFYIFKSGKRTLRSSRRRIESNHNKRSTVNEKWIPTNTSVTGWELWRLLAIFEDTRRSPRADQERTRVTKELEQVTTGIGKQRFESEASEQSRGVLLGRSRLRGCRFETKLKRARFRNQVIGSRIELQLKLKEIESNKRLNEK